MFGLLSFGSGLLFIGSLFVVYFRWFRSGSPDKLTNVSSSGESETPEQYGKFDSKQEHSKTKTNLEAKSNGGQAFGHKNEGAQLVHNEENEGNENLRYRLSAEKAKSHKQDTEGETKTKSTESNALNELVEDDSIETQKENEIACNKNSLGEVLPACEGKEVKKQGPEIEINTHTCIHVEISNKAPGKSAVSEVFENTQGNEETTQIAAQKFVQEHELDSVKDIDNRQEEANINNAIESVLNEPLTVESNALQKAKRQDVLVEEPLVKIGKAISSEAAVELQEESSFSLEGRRESIKEPQDIAGDLSNDLNLEVIANEPTKPLGVEEINNTQAENANIEHFVADHAVDDESGDSMRENAEIIDENQYANLMQSDDISDPQVNDVGPADNVIEKFSNRLSKCIIDAVLQDAQLLYSQSEDETDENRNESILKFSDILAESIVRSVVDYTKISQDHISEHDEHDRLSPSVADVRDKTNENIVPSEPSPTNEEEIFSADEANDDTCAMREYAKRLSQQILSDVLDLNEDSNRRLSTDAYASKLTRSVLSNVINGARSEIGDSNSLADSDLGVESALDLFISGIVGNALESAISRIGRETCRDTEEHNGIEGDLQEQQGEHSEGHVENHMDRESHLGIYNGQDVEEDSIGNKVDHVGNEGQLGIYNREIDTPGQHIDHDENEPGRMSGSNTQPVQQNGKFQSKWLSEDDLDELYDDDLSDEEAMAPEQSSKSAQNGDNKPATSENHLTTPKDEKQFWRKSLIDDLDDDFDFDDEIETPRSSLSSSPTKSGNFEDVMVDGSGESDDEVLEASTNVKVQAPVVKATDSSRSRLRSVDTTPVLVLDNGSAFLKVGFSDQALPKEIVASVVGTPLRYSQDISGMEYTAKPGLVFGSSAMGKAGVLHIEYPLKSDLVEKWSDVEGLWNYVLSSLMCIQDNPDFPVLISQPGLNAKKNTEKIAEIMFEHFHMPSLFIADQLALSLFSMGYTSGLSFSSGFKSTQAGVVYEGHVLPHTVKQLDIAGYQLTENLKKLLMSLQGFGFRSSSQWQIVDDIKKKLGFFSLDFEADSKRYKTQADLQTTYELPDGQVIEVGLERFGCAESLFRPMEVGLTQSPAHKLINEAINSCEEELQELCYKAMGVSGGTTQMTGFVARLQQELREHDRKFKNFTAPEHRDLSTWLGGSVVASLPTFREMVVTVDEYAESGARVVHSKCF